MLQLRVRDCSAFSRWVPFAQDPDHGHNGTTGKKTGCKINKLPSSFQDHLAHAIGCSEDKCNRAAQARAPREKGAKTHM